MKIVWRFLQIACAAAVIFGATLIYINVSQPRLARRLSLWGNQMVSVISGNKLSLITEKDEAQGDVRWESNRATVFIETKNPILISAYKEAIANWNKTKVFRFELVDKKEQADILVGEYSDAKTKAAGQSDISSGVDTHLISRVDVKLNTYYLTDNDFGYTFERIVHTAEHELGHAIGLSHHDSSISVMQSSGSYEGIQKVDIQAVEKLYKLKKEKLK